MDNSFFRFCSNFEKSKDLQNSVLSELNYDMQIHLKPGEAYSCITNVSEGIAFDNNFQAFIVDCENNVLLDVSDLVYINEFTHSKNGSQQAMIEILGINKDFYSDLVQLRLDHNIYNGKSYWSNPFLNSKYDIDETSVFSFSNSTMLDGTDYTTARIFQKIRLKCHKQKNSFIDTQQTYTTFDGLKYSSRLIKTKSYDFIFDFCSDFIYDRLQYLFSHDIIYVNSVRVTDKHTHENTDKLGSSNVSQNKFKLSVNEEDIYKDTFQVFERNIPRVLQFIPKGSYSDETFEVATENSQYFRIVFSTEILLTSAFVLKLYRGSTFLGQVGIENVSIENETTVLVYVGNLTGIFITGVYTVVVQPNGVYASDILGPNFYQGTASNEWVYMSKQGFFNGKFFNNDQFNTN